MGSLSKIYGLLDRTGCPNCTKALIMAVWQAQQRGTRLKMSTQAFLNGTDARPARELGILSQMEDGTIVFTKKAQGMIR